MIIKDLGILDYEKCFHDMKEFTNSRNSQTPDEIWLVEHPSVYTLGLAGKESHILNIINIPIIKTDRGGQVTYHGLGQVVVYPLLNLHRMGIYVKELVFKIEQSIINTLNYFNINGFRYDGAPGIYIAKSKMVKNMHDIAKISALGLKITRGYSYHGLALNVNMDLRPFFDINPCGYSELETIDMQSLIGDIDINVVKKTLIDNLTKILYN